jgi:hypothetical protein
VVGFPGRNFLRRLLGRESATVLLCEPTGGPVGAVAQSDLRALARIRSDR